jgi:O-antigen/teichoic acid export membrane protein
VSRQLSRLASDTLVYGVGAAVNGLLGVLLLPLYAHVFAPADFGRLGLVTTSVSLVTVFAALALDNSAGRWFWSTDDTEDRKRSIASWFWCQLAVSGVLMAVFLAAAGPIARSLLGGADSALYLRLAVVTVPLATLPTVAINWYRLNRRPVATTLFSLGVAAFTTALTAILLLPAHLGLEGLFLAELVGAAAASVVAAFQLKDWIKPSLFSRARLTEMLRYSGPLIPSAVAFWVVGVSDRYLVNAFRNVSDVGLYQMSNTISAGVAVITLAFQQAWGPFAFSIHREKDSRPVYADAFLAYLWVGCLAATALSVLAPDVLTVLGASRYLGATSAVFPLAMGNVMMGLVYIAALGPGIVKKTGPIGMAITAAAVLNIGLNLVLIPWVGRDGAAYATLAAEALVPVYLFRRSQQLYPIPYRFAPGIALIGLAAAVNELLARWHPATTIESVGVKMLALLVFVPAAFWAGIVRPSQLLALARRVRPRSRVGGR